MKAYKSASQFYILIFMCVREISTLLVVLNKFGQKQCTKECLSRPVCLGVSYNQNELQCVLHIDTVSEFSNYGSNGFITRNRSQISEV